MGIVSFEAPAGLNARLDYFAKELERSKASLVQCAVEEYLEDLEDYLEAKRYKAEYNPRENLSFEEIKRKYKLD